MLTKLLLLTALVCIANCGINNIPKYDSTERVIDCTDDKRATGVCDVMLVVDQASPAGTHWYHARSGKQRSDGLYGTFIVKDTLPGYEDVDDSPDEHTLLLMDWQREASLDIFLKHHTRARFFKETPIDDPPYAEYEQYSLTFGPDYLGVSPIPFWSGIINDKGRFYNERGQPNVVSPNCDNLNCFNVIQGHRYRFRVKCKINILCLRDSYIGSIFCEVAWCVRHILITHTG